MALLFLKNYCGCSIAQIEVLNSYPQKAKINMKNEDKLFDLNLQKSSQGGHFSLGIFGENLRYCYSLGIIVVIMQKLTFCHSSAIT